MTDGASILPRLNALSARSDVVGAFGFVAYTAADPGYVKMTGDPEYRAALDFISGPHFALFMASLAVPGSETASRDLGFLETMSSAESAELMRLLEIAHYRELPRFVVLVPAADRILLHKGVGLSGTTAAAAFESLREHLEITRRSVDLIAPECFDNGAAVFREIAGRLEDAALWRLGKKTAKLAAWLASL